MATLKGSFPSGSPVQCSALSIHKCCLSSVGSLGKVPTLPPTPPPKDCVWERGPSPACQKPLIHCHHGQLSPPWKWRELTSVEVFQKDPLSLSPFPVPPHLMPTQCTKIPVNLRVLFLDLRREHGKDDLILDNSSGRLENTIAVPLLNSFTSLFSFLTMTTLRALNMLQG